MVYPLVTYFFNNFIRIRTFSYQVYSDLAQIRPPILDEVGRVVVESRDEWSRRSGVGRVLCCLAEFVDSKDAVRFIKIVRLVSSNCSCIKKFHLVASYTFQVVPQGLADRSVECRNGMRNAAVDVIRRHGRTIMTDLLPLLGEHLQLLAQLPRLFVEAKFS